MKLATTQAVYAHWLSLCGDRAAPDRHDLDPAAMRGMLAHTFMLEVSGSSPGGRSFTIRLSGTRLDALFGRVMKGENFLALWAEAAKADLAELLDAVLDDTQPMLFGLTGAARDHEAEAFELLVLPLRHHGRTQARLLCCLVPSRTPSWIGLRPLGPMALQGWRALDRRVEAAALVPSSRDGEPAPIRRGHLTVYAGGRLNADAPAPRMQVRVNDAMARSIRTHLSSRRP